MSIVTGADNVEYPVRMADGTLEFVVEYRGKIIKASGSYELKQRLDRAIREHELKNTKVNVSEKVLVYNAPNRAFPDGRQELIELRGYHRKSGDLMVTREDGTKDTLRESSLGTIYAFSSTNVTELRALLAGHGELLRMAGEIKRRLSEIRVKAPYFPGDNDQRYMDKSNELAELCAKARENKILPEKK